MGLETQSRLLGLAKAMKAEKFHLGHNPLTTYRRLVELSFRPRF